MLVSTTVLLCCCYIPLTLGLLKPSVLEKTALEQQQALSNVIKEFSRNLNKLLERIKLEKYFQFIVYLKATHTRCIFDEVIKDLPFSLFIWNKRLDELDIMLKYNKEITVISCELETATAKEVKNDYFRQIPYVIYLQSHELPSINKTCLNLFLNGEYSRMIMISEEFLQTPVFHHCGIFSKYNSYNMLAFEADKSIRIFHKPFRGFMYTVANILPPFNIILEDQKGRLQLESYVGNCVKTYAERRKVQLSFYGHEKVIHYKDFEEYVVDGLADMYSIVVPLKHESLNERFSYPLEFMEECFMIPLPTVKPLNKLFLNIIELEVLLIIPLLSIVYAIFLSIGQYNTIRHLNFMNVMLSDKSIRGLLGQSFVLPLKISLFTRYSYVLIFFTNLMLMTFYNAFMQSNLIAPPLEKTIENMEDIRKAGLKIAVHRRDLEDWHFMFYKDYQDIIYNMTSSYANFVSLRESLNTSYVYPIAYPLWTIYEEKQKFFQRKLFFYSRKLCVPNPNLASIPMRSNFDDVEGFNQHLLDVQAAGLVKYWLSKVFLILMRLKNVTIIDISTSKTYDGFIHWRDLFWIWYSFLGCMLVSLLIFVGEVITYKMCNYFQRTVQN